MIAEGATSARRLADACINLRARYTTRAEAGTDPGLPVLSYISSRSRGTDKEITTTPVQAPGASTIAAASWAACSASGWIAMGPALIEPVHQQHVRRDPARLDAAMGPALIEPVHLPTPELPDVA